MSLYNVVLLSITTAVVEYFLRDQHERSYILTSVFILLCVTITLLLVFVPKVLEVAKDPRSTAKPQRAVLANAEKKAATVPKVPEKKIEANDVDDQKWLSKIKQLNEHNDRLKSSALKVCSRWVTRSICTRIVDALRKVQRP